MSRSPSEVIRIGRAFTGEQIGSPLVDSILRCKWSLGGQGAFFLLVFMLSQAMLMFVMIVVGQIVVMLAMSSMMLHAGRKTAMLMAMLDMSAMIMRVIWMRSDCMMFVAMFGVGSMIVMMFGMTFVMIVLLVDTKCILDFVGPE